MTKNPKIDLYTDGGCAPNPGRGGIGVVMLSSEHQREYCIAYEATTNNRMELRAVLSGLERIRTPSTVILHSDSRYVLTPISTAAIYRWQKKNWMQKKTKPYKNADLWAQLLPQIKKHYIICDWIRGHTGNRYNERCDYLATHAIKNLSPHTDTGYLQDATPVDAVQTSMFDGQKKIITHYTKK